MWPEEAAVLPDVFTEQGGYATSALFNDERALIRAICAELGVNPKGSEETVAARLAALEAGLAEVAGEVSGGEIPAGNRSVKLAAWRGNAGNLQNTPSWQPCVTYDNNPTTIWPYVKSVGTDYSGWSYNGAEARFGWLTQAEWNVKPERWLRFTFGASFAYKYASTVYDWGELGIAILDNATGQFLTSEVRAHTAWPRHKGDGALWQVGDSDGNTCWVLKATVDLQCVRQVNRHLRALVKRQNAAHSNPHGGDPWPNYSTTGIGWFAQVEELD